LPPFQSLSRDSPKTISRPSNSSIFWSPTLERAFSGDGVISSPKPRQGSLPPIPRSAVGTKSLLIGRNDEPIQEDTGEWAFPCCNPRFSDRIGGLPPAHHSESGPLRGLASLFLHHRISGDFLRHQVEPFYGHYRCGPGNGVRHPGQLCSIQDGILGEEYGRHPLGYSYRDISRGLRFGPAHLL